jgi:hypothetical protein
MRRVASAESVRSRVVNAAIFATMVACERSDMALRSIGSPVPPVVLAAAGCRQFDRGNDHIKGHVPAGFRLRLDTTFEARLAALGRRTSLSLKVIPEDSSLARRNRLSWWGVDSTDVQLLHVTLGDGFSGVAFRLRQAADTIRGDVRAYSDAPPTLLPPHSVRARRVQCP